MKKLLLAAALLSAISAFAVPHVWISSPNGGETYQVGDTLTVTWTEDSSVAEIKLVLVRDDANIYYTITGQYQLPKNDYQPWGTFKWVIPDSILVCVEDNSPDGCTDTKFSMVSSRWKVKIDNPYHEDGDSWDFSNGYISITPKNAVEKVSSIADKASMSVFPNPLNSVTVYSFSVPSAGNVKIDVVDASGRKIETLVDGRFTKGVHQASWSSEKLPAGTYLFNMQFGSTRLVKTAKIIK